MIKLLVVGEEEAQKIFEDRLKDLADMVFVSGDQFGLDSLASHEFSDKDVLIAFSVNVDEAIRQEFLNFFNHLVVSFLFDPGQDSEQKNDVPDIQYLAGYIAKSLANLRDFAPQSQAGATDSVDPVIDTSIVGIAESLIRQELEELSRLDFLQAETTEECRWSLEEYRTHLQSLLETFAEKKLFKNEQELGIGTSLFLAEYSTYLKRNREFSKAIESLVRAPVYYFDLDRYQELDFGKDGQRALLAAFLVYFELIKFLEDYDQSNQADKSELHFLGPEIEGSDSKNSLLPDSETLKASFKELDLSLEFTDGNVRLGVPLPFPVA